MLCQLSGSFIFCVFLFVTQCSRGDAVRLADVLSVVKLSGADMHAGWYLLQAQALGWAGQLDAMDAVLVCQRQISGSKRKIEPWRRVGQRNKRALIFLIFFYFIPLLVLPRQQKTVESAGLPVSLDLITELIYHHGRLRDIPVYQLALRHTIKFTPSLLAL